MREVNQGRARRLPRPAGAVAAAVGGVLGVGFAVMAVVRRGKPLHPVGAVAAGVLAVTPGYRPSGCPLLDRAGRYDCLVRASYAVGCGPKLPDIEGFALRALPAGDAADPTEILFASTGTGPLGRYLLTPRAPGRHGSQTTLLPVEAQGRPLQLRLEPLDVLMQPWPTRYEVSWAHGRGPWETVAELTVAWAGDADAAERFDPVVHGLPGTSQYAVWALLREPAYRLARRARPAAGRLT